MKLGAGPRPRWQRILTLGQRIGLYSQGGGEPGMRGAREESYMRDENSLWVGRRPQVDIPIGP